MKTTEKLVTGKRKKIPDTPYMVGVLRAASPRKVRSVGVSALLITEEDVQTVKTMQALPLDEHEAFIEMRAYDWLKRKLPPRQLKIFLIIRKNPKAKGEAYCKFLDAAGLRPPFKATTPSSNWKKCPASYLAAYREKNAPWAGRIQKEKFLIEQKGNEALAKIPAF